MCGSPSLAAPQVPAKDPSEIALEQAQLTSLNKQNSLYDNLLPVMSQEMGLVRGADGSYSLSPDAADQLKYQQALAKQQTQLGLASLPLASQYSKLAMDQLAEQQRLAPIQNQVAEEQANRQLEALRGNLPLPESMQQQKTAEYKQLVQQHALIGNTITGDTPEAAASSSTGGQQALKDFNNRWAATQDAYRLNQLNAGTQLYQSGVGLTSGLSNSGYGASMGFSNPTGYVSGSPTFTGALPNTNYLGLAAGYGSAMQPYQFQRQMQYNSNATGSQNFVGLLSGLLGGGSQLGAAKLLAG